MVVAEPVKQIKDRYGRAGLCRHLRLGQKDVGRRLNAENLAVKMEIRKDHKTPSCKMKTVECFLYHITKHADFQYPISV